MFNGELRKVWILGLAAILLLLAGCADLSVIASFDSYAEAEETGSVEGGWILDYIPATAGRIIEAHDLDTNQSCGKVELDTAVFGAPVEVFLDDSGLFCDAFVRYYTDFEADYAWVADTGIQVVGYLPGGIDTAAQRKKYLIRTIAPLEGRVFQGKYKLGSKTWRLARSLLGGVMRKEYPHLKYDDTPLLYILMWVQPPEVRDLGRNGWMLIGISSGSWTFQVFSWVQPIGMKQPADYMRRQDLNCWILGKHGFGAAWLKDL